MDATESIRKEKITQTFREEHDSDHPAHSNARRHAEELKVCGDYGHKHCGSEEVEEFASSSSHLLFTIIILVIFLNYHRIIIDFLHRVKTLVVVVAAARGRDRSDDPGENAQ